MRLAGSTRWLVTDRAAGQPSGDGAGVVGADGISRAELERWLCDPSVPAPSFCDMVSAFGLPFDVLATVRGGALRRELRFTLALLRDAFPTDAAVRRWLRAPAGEVGGQRPLDLLLRGRIKPLEELAVRAWNRTSTAGADGATYPPCPAYAAYPAAGRRPWRPQRR